MISKSGEKPCVSCLSSFLAQRAYKKEHEDILPLKKNTQIQLIMTDCTVKQSAVSNYSIISSKTKGVIKR